MTSKMFSRKKLPEVHTTDELNDSASLSPNLRTEEEGIDNIIKKSSLQKAELLAQALNELVTKRL